MMHSVSIPNSKRRRGYTLMEMIVTMSSATMLMTGLASSLVIATSAFEMDTGALAQKGSAAQVQADMMADLQHALSFSERTATAVTFTVPDRDGDTNPETIRYAWSGTPGDPLTYQYNGGTAVNLAEDVQAFDLSYLTRDMAASFLGPENVLFVVTSTLFPSYQEQLRKSQLESWGYTVDLHSASASQSSYNSAIAINDVVYVSEEISSGDVSTKLRNASIGVVNGEAALTDEIGFSSTGSNPSVSTTNILDNSHYITSQFSTGSLTLFSSAQDALVLSGTLAGGIETLSETNDSGTNRPGLAVIAAGEALNGGGVAAGRRVQLPWGGNSFNFGALTDDGLTLLKRSIDWAGEQTPVIPVSQPVFEEFTETKDTTAGTSINIAKPSGTASGDLLIAAVSVENDTENFMTAPAGWTELYIQDRDSAVTFGVWWKIAGGSESSSYTFSWSGGASEEAYGWIMRFTGHDPANPINVFSWTRGTGTSATSPAATTTVDNALVLRLGGFDHDNINVDSTGLTNHTDITMDEANRVSGGAGYTYQATAGDTGTDAFTLTSSQEWVTITLGIAPAP